MSPMGKGAIPTCRTKIPLKCWLTSICWAENQKTAMAASNIMVDYQDGQIAFSTHNLILLLVSRRQRKAAAPPQASQAVEDLETDPDGGAGTVLAPLPHPTPPTHIMPPSVRRPASTDDRASSPFRSPAHPPFARTLARPPGGWQAHLPASRQYGSTPPPPPLTTTFTTHPHTPPAHPAP